MPLFTAIAGAIQGALYTAAFVVCAFVEPVIDTITKPLGWLADALERREAKKNADTTVSTDDNPEV